MNRFASEPTPSGVTYDEILLGASERPRLRSAVGIMSALLLFFSFATAVGQLVNWVGWLILRPGGEYVDWLRASAAFTTPWGMLSGHLALAMKDGDCECEDYVEIMYIIGCGLHKMDEPGAGPAAARLAGMEFALDAQARLAATGGKLTGCAALTPLISARQSGTLAAMLEE